MSGVAPPPARPLAPYRSVPLTSQPPRANLRATNSDLPCPSANNLRILSRHNGCFKCRYYYTNHGACDCQVPPSQYNRAPITDSTGLKVRPSCLPALVPLRTKTETIAAIDNIPMHEQVPTYAYESIVAAAETSESNAPSNEVTTGEPSMPSTINEEPEIINIDDDDIEMEYIAAALDITSVYSDASLDSEEYIAPLQTPHFHWNCHLFGPQSTSPVTIDALLDHGSSLMMIDATIADKLKLRKHQLKQPLSVRMVVGEKGKIMHDFIHITPISPCSKWRSKPLKALVVPSLCTPLLLGGPFLVANEMVLDHASRTCISKGSQFDILNPVKSEWKILSPKKKALQQIKMAKDVKNVSLKLLKERLSGK